MNSCTVVDTLDYIFFLQLLFTGLIFNVSFSSLLQQLAKNIHSFLDIYNIRLVQLH